MMSVPRGQRTYSIYVGGTHGNAGCMPRAQFRYAFECYAKETLGYQFVNNTANIMKGVNTK